MKCNEVLKDIDKYFDSNIDKKFKIKIHEHLKTCIKCNKIFKKYNTMFQLLDSLPHSINPSKNNWVYIKKNINKKTKNIFNYYPKLSFATLTIFFILLFLTLYLSIIRPNNNNNPKILTEFNVAANEYKRAKKKLLIIIKSKKEYLDNETIHSIESNLIIIDNAINDISIALKSDPSNQMLALQLANIYQRQITLISNTNKNILTINNN